MTITRNCRCGASMRVTANPAELADHLAALFDLGHIGPGHAPTTAEKAAAARRREERELVRRNTP